MKLLAELIAPAEVVNDDFVTVTEIGPKNGSHISEGEELIFFETSKSIISIESPHAGYLEILCNIEDEVEVGSVVGKIWDAPIDKLPLDIVKKESNKIKSVAAAIISVAAKQLIKQFDVDVTDVSHNGLIGKAQIMSYLGNSSTLDVNDLLKKQKSGMENILFVGTGLHADTVHSILNADRTSSKNIIGVITHDANLVGKHIDGNIVVGIESDLSIMLLNELALANIKIIVGYSFKDKRVCKARAKIMELIYQTNIEVVNIVHTTAMIEPSVILGTGNQIAQGVIIGNKVVLGSCNIINSGSIISHDCKIGNNSHIAPGAVLGGNVVVGNNCLIGMNATIFADVVIPDNSFIPNMGNITSSEYFL